MDRGLKSYTKMIFLSVILCLMTFLYACSSEESGGSGDKVQISLSVWGMPFENALYTDIYIPEFEEQNPDIEVEFLHYDELRDRYLTLGAANDLPDVMRSPGVNVPEFINRGMFIPLDDYIESENLDMDNYPEASWVSMQKDDQTFAIPQDANSTVLYYDPEAFAEAGLEEPNHDYTMEQMLEDAEKLTIKGNNGNIERYGFVMGWNADNFANFVLANGGNIWNEDGTVSTVDSSESIEALEYWRDLVVDFQLTTSTSDQAQMGPDAYFQARQAAMYIDGTWMAPSIKNAAPDFNYKATSFPEGKEKVSRSMSSSFGISKDSDHPDEAWKLIQFLTEKEQLDVYWQSLWVAAPAALSSLEDEESFRNVTGVPEADVPGIDSEEEFDEKLGYLKDLFDNQWLDQTWISPYQNYYADHIDNAIQSVLTEGADPEEALVEAAENINASINQN
ncbi:MULTISPECIES: ABC transporter substrate-binding protein [Gracilibacillus]|uniref:ABC transporter substrate-binding protein n=1 Tax=Gracilibacillus TaxID=74385 RepID=UPI0008241E76|nr:MULTISPECIES: sugar ABC transporter substrate-binding protein [Gracilibacillus]